MRAISRKALRSLGVSSAFGSFGGRVTAGAGSIASDPAASAGRAGAGSDVGLKGTTTPELRAAVGATLPAEPFASAASSTSTRSDS